MRRWNPFHSDQLRWITKHPCTGGGKGTLGHRHFAHMPESCRTTGNAGICKRKAKDNAYLSVPATVVEAGSTTFFTASQLSIDKQLQVRRLWGSGDKRSR